MNLLNKIFGKTTEPRKEKELPWVPLTHLSQLEDIKERSKHKTQLLFKHSTRCGISSMVMNQFVKAYDNVYDFDLYYLDLLNYREISNEVANTFQVIHESPQLLVIANGRVVAYESHGAINEINLEQFVF
ncbi:bacillithiol system redox-active protein YtxJ [Tamlana fucoidanivorans]|uniref:Bacillithiol system redox-active protein YtxJ n=1 Tax=Allotamlana fucoidanivorans TaxID=2583814 RepID=A0A5C4SHZ8_9FLAO|nr:bacillithiol system redox-active protein YtxJ [Tamlana fucoidanivorans]TNJ42972.1 bacillithiol system redox-active protein YtxJ [Tamlana fucoidanivorans]